MTTPNEGLFNRIMNYLFGPPAPTEIWKTTHEEFLRRVKVYSDGPDYIEYYDVYAIHQTSLSTGNSRIQEEWRFS